MDGNSPANRNISSQTCRKFFLVHDRPPIFLSSPFPALALTASAVQRPAPETPKAHSCYLLSSCVLISLLAKPLWVGVGAVEPMTRFIKLELACFRGFCRFRQKRGNLGRIHRLKTAGCLKSLLKNRERIAARDNETGRKIHSVVKALHRGGCFALENNVITHGLHAEHADIVLEQDGQNSLFETIEVRVHYVERHLYGIEREAVF